VDTCIEENKEICSNIKNELKNQKKMIGNSQKNIENIDENLSHSKRIIRKINKSCIIT